ncbi:MAG: isopeptide-forming domain-containing fimbrial protein [Oscillospiraceae bacterium]|nr:isopeptide-forming domain-containing fimbrial protein [Oscillospiraceae bacterium]
MTKANYTHPRRYLLLLVTLLILSCIMMANTLEVSAARPPLVVTDMEKKATPEKFVDNGDIISYTISFTMPSNLDGYIAAKIVDVLPTTGLSYNNTATLTIGGSTSAVVMTATGNTLSYEFTGISFKDTAGQLIVFQLDFTVTGWSSGIIANEAQVYFMQDYPDIPDAFDEEEIELAIGPPTEVEELPGDRKTALLWADPEVGIVDYYQIKIDNGTWVDYQLIDLTFDAAAGSNGKWYLLFENLPDNTRLVNNTTYTFQIRAIDPDGYIGVPYTITSTPGPLGDIGGRNTDLVAIYANDVMPQGGWPNNGTVGTSPSTPHEVVLQMPANFMYIVIHRNFINVGQDATFVMYSDTNFTNEIVIIDRLDNDFNWLNEIHIYIHVTSGNLQVESFYHVIITV